MPKFNHELTSTIRQKEQLVNQILIMYRIFFKKAPYLLSRTFYKIAKDKFFYVVYLLWIIWAIFSQQFDLFSLSTKSTELLFLVNLPQIRKQKNIYISFIFQYTLSS